MAILRTMSTVVLSLTHLFIHSKGNFLCAHICCKFWDNSLTQNCLCSICAGIWGYKMSKPQSWLSRNLSSSRRSQTRARKMNVVVSMTDSMCSIKSGDKGKSGQTAENSYGNSEPTMKIHFSLSPC